MVNNSTVLLKFGARELATVSS